MRYAMSEPRFTVTLGAVQLQWLGDKGLWLIELDQTHGMKLSDKDLEDMGQMLEKWFWERM